MLFVEVNVDGANETGRIGYIEGHTGLKYK